LDIFVRDFGRQKDGFDKQKKWLGKGEKWFEKPSAVGGVAVQAGGPFDYAQGRLSAGRVEVCGIPHLAR
jgi:hypothetical protein